MRIEKAEGILFPFGKYKGKALVDVMDINHGYLVWVAHNVELEKYGLFKEAFEVFMNDPQIIEQIRIYEHEKDEDEEDEDMESWWNKC